MDNLIPVIQATITLLSVLAAVLAWAAKLRWSEEYSTAKEAQIANLESTIQSLKDSKEETIKTKEAQITALKSQIANMEKLYEPRVVTERVLAMKQLMDEQVSLIEEEIKSTKNRLRVAQSEIERKDQEISETRQKSAESQSQVRDLEEKREAALHQAKVLEEQVKELEARVTRYEKSREVISRSGKTVSTDMTSEGVGTFGGLLKQYRRDTGLSKNELANRLTQNGYSISPETLDRLEYNVVLPGGDFLAYLVNHLSIDDVREIDLLFESLSADFLMILIDQYQIAMQEIRGDKGT